MLLQGIVGGKTGLKNGGVQNGANVEEDDDDDVQEIVEGEEEEDDDDDDEEDDEEDEEDDDDDEDVNFTKQILIKLRPIKF